MPSTTHQWLQLWLARRMVADGFTILGYDGQTPQGDTWNALPPPALLAGARPDAWGVHGDTGQLAVGEAKTSQDVATAHTSFQLRAFGALFDDAIGRYCRFYIAVPRSAIHPLDRVLAACGLAGASHIVRLHIPDCIVESASDDDA